MTDEQRHINEQVVEKLREAKQYLILSVIFLVLGLSCIVGAIVADSWVLLALGFACSFMNWRIGKKYKRVLAEATELVMKL